MEQLGEDGGALGATAEPGEYYNAFDGNYGGLWRRSGRPPQVLAGVGFSAQGTFVGSYYRRNPDTYDNTVSWVFDGVDDVLGDFGLCGGGGSRLRARPCRRASRLTASSPVGSSSRTGSGIPSPMSTPYKAELVRSLCQAAIELTAFFQQSLSELAEPLCDFAGVEILRAAADGHGAGKGMDRNNLPSDPSRA